jgi:hypothetical protein
MVVMHSHLSAVAHKQKQLAVGAPFHAGYSDACFFAPQTIAVERAHDNSAILVPGPKITRSC